MKIIERHNRFEVVSTTDPKLTIVAFSTRGHAEDFIRRRSTNLEALQIERRGGKTSGSGGEATKQWGYSGHY
jgi:hypothetical protein